MKKTLLRSLKHPVAIAMWDFCWLLRSYDGGGFEDIEKALDELVERGYNAVRIDCFPHLVSCDDRKKFFFSYNPETCSIWHHEQNVTVNPKEGLKKLLTGCRKRGIYVGLSTWIQWPDERTKLDSSEDFINAWEKTIRFLRENDLWHNILYVDFLNEYPYWHGFSALKAAAGKADKKIFHSVSESNMQNLNIDKFGRKGKKYLRDFSAEVIKYFSSIWDDVDYGFCITTNVNKFRPDRVADFSAFGFFDLHLWFAHYKDMWSLQTELEKANSPEEWNEVILKIEKRWEKDGKRITKWMEKNFRKHRKWAEKYNAPVGNTEGWGFVAWPTHAKNWEYQKMASEICVNLAIKYNYTFICTTNFTHPYFSALWKDVQWHRKMTSLIKSVHIDREYI